MHCLEIELKLAVPAAEPARDVLTTILSPQGGSGRTRRLVSTYYDTPDWALAGAGLSLRVRVSDGGGHRQTVKTAAKGGSGLLSRSEWETDIEAGGVDATMLQATGLAVFGDPELIARLEPVFTTTIERRVYPASGGEGDDAWEIEVALDHGAITAAGLSEPVNEIELELKRGHPRHVFALARRLAKAIDGRPLIATKSDRGFRLATGRLNTPQKAKAPPLSVDLTVAAAFQTIARSCLDHLLVNERCLLASGDGEAIHQMRVALRRLRSAIKIFRPAILSPDLESVKTEIRWLLANLGPARDADVFLAEIVDPVAAHHPGAHGLAELRAHWLADRDARLSSAIEAVKSRRFSALVLMLGEWVETGDWLAAKGTRTAARLGEPISQFALSRMGKATRRLQGSVRDTLSRLPPEEQHLVRIHCKQVRYAGEFFAALVPRKQMRVFLAELAELQDVLGQLNDIAVAGPKLTGKGMNGAKARAAGLITGWHQSRRSQLTAEADRAWKHWRNCPLPWQGM